MKWTLALALAACGGGGARGPATPAGPTTAPAMTGAKTSAAGPVELAVRVFQWNCTLENARGDEAQLEELEPLHLPIGVPIHMKVTNSDGFHDLDIEAPGASGHYAKRGGTGELTFTLDHAGTYTWKCPVQEPPISHSEGPPPPEHPTTHTIVAESPAEWAAYTRAWDDAHDMRKPENKIALARKLYEKKGCMACHTIDGTPRVGPSWAGIWGKPVKGSDGRVRTIDAAFVRESILSPQAFIAERFPAAMPSYEGQLKKQEIDALVAYIQSLGATP